MKKVFLLVLIGLSHLAQAQIKGNQNIITRSIDISGIEAITVSLYADIQIDCAAPEGMTITIDENLMDKVDADILDGKLELDQREWISPSQRVLIKIGAPNLKRIEQGTHETTTVRNINRDNFVAQALVGKIVLEGKVSTFNANGEVGQIMAEGLSADKVYVNLWNWGSIDLGSPKSIEGSVQEGTVRYEGSDVDVKVKTKGDGQIIDRIAKTVSTKFDTKWIDFKLKNNSLKRINLYVKGPKPNGKYFSYGFPMNPGQVRKKNWTVGSKVYRESRLGTRKLLMIIEEDAEGNTVNLYSKS